MSYQAFEIDHLYPILGCEDTTNIQQVNDLALIRKDINLRIQSNLLAEACNFHDLIIRESLDVEIGRNISLSAHSNRLGY